MDVSASLGRFKHPFALGARIFGLLLLTGVLLAACGDDDDDVDLNQGNDPTPTVAMTATTGDSDDDQEATATEATGMTSTPEVDATPTDSGASMDSTATEDMDDAATEDDDDDSTRATATEGSGANATATEGSGSDATATEGSGSNATAPASGTAGGRDDWRGRTATIGERFEVDDDIAFTVEGVEEVMGIPGVIEPGSGNRFIAIELTVENGDDDPLRALEVLRALRIETQDGTQFEVDPLVSATLLTDRDVFEQDINAGESVTANIAFEVPANDDNLYLVIDDDADDDDDDDDDDDLVRVDLSEELSR